MRSVRARLRLRSDEGFGLIELVIAMTVLNIGILAIVAAFNSGALALRRASVISSASAVADGQMETYRALRNCAIYLDHTQVAAAPTSYTSDSAYNATQILDNNRGSLATPLNGSPSGTACPVASYTIKRAFGRPLAVGIPISSSELTGSSLPQITSVGTSMNGSRRSVL